MNRTDELTAKLLDAVLTDAERAELERRPDLETERACARDQPIADLDGVLQVGQ